MGERRLLGGRKDAEVAHLAAVPQPRQCRARYGFTFEPASKTPLKPVELSERWSVSLQIL